MYSVFMSYRRKFYIKYNGCFECNRIACSNNISVFEYSNHFMEEIYGNIINYLLYPVCMHIIRNECFLMNEIRT